MSWGHPRACSLPPAKPTVLQEVNCAGSARADCVAPWVYCIDSYCEAPVNGVSKCYCWIQASGKSALPGASDAGAPCVLQETSSYGEAMCQSMMDGELWSTFGYLSVNTTYLPPFATADCEAKTPMTYCWGAKCVEDPSRPGGAICDCPFVTSNTTAVNIQISVEQCGAEAGKTCDYLHNGNVAGASTSEVTQGLVGLYQNITGTKVPVIPTCEELPSTEPLVLGDIGCDQHKNYVCEAPWVYCIDAICNEPIAGYSTCKCNNQAPGSSVIPGSVSSGATCVGNTSFNKTEPYGEALCQSMQKGELWSTYGGKYGNTSYVTPYAQITCNSTRGFAFCWGAKCVQDPTDPAVAICKCPFVTNKNGWVGAVQEQECRQQGVNACDYIHNGGPRPTDRIEAIDVALHFFGGETVATCDGGNYDPGLKPADASSPASPPSSAYAPRMMAASLAMFALLW